MSKRPTISDLAAVAGVSVATVDRVLNGRLPVRGSTADRVLRAAESIGYHAVPLLRGRVRKTGPARRFGVLLQKKADAFYQHLAASFEAAARAYPDGRIRLAVEFIEELSPTTVVDALRRLGAVADALAIVSIDHPFVSQEIARLRAEGIPTVAMVTDLTAEDRIGYVGRDNRKEGRTAGWMIARAAREPGKVGIIVGSHRFLCQETAEISFRSYFREHAPGFRLMEPLVNLDDPRIAYEATHDLMAGNPDIVGIYICGGGTEGVIRAAREGALAGRVAIVCNELTDITRSALIDGVLTAVISTPMDAMVARTVAMLMEALNTPAAMPARQEMLPFELYVSENV